MKSPLNCHEPIEEQIRIWIQNSVVFLYQCHDLVGHELAFRDEALIVSVIISTDDKRLFSHNNHELKPQYTETGPAKIQEIVINYTGSAFESLISWPTLGVINYEKSSNQSLFIVFTNQHFYDDSHLHSSEQ